MYICSLCGVIRQNICKIAAFPAVLRDDEINHGRIPATGAVPRISHTP